ncbi:MAG: metal dependent phosphohydrolase [Clostridiaceae bacterium]|jgi:hypothetical protein|nr:metal dependent phosphohydrolase [Clostridiaceae bacterium]
MNIQDVFKNAKAQISFNELIKIDKDNYDSVVDIFPGLGNLTYEEIKQSFDNQKLNPDNIYYCLNSIYPFWYIEGHCQISIHLSKGDIEDIFEFLKIKETLDVRNKFLQEYWEKKEYLSYFSLVTPQFNFALFQEKINELPNNMLYDIFLMLYTSSDYGFKDIPENIIRKIFQSKLDRNMLTNEMLINNLPLDENGNVIIYRGMASESSPIDKAFSWTTNINTAITFAVRFSTEKSVIYKATVSINNIIDYIEEPESEVLVFPEHIISPQIINSYSLKDLIDSKEFDKYLEFWKYKNYTITNSPELYANEPHGILHAKRVTFLTVIYSYFMKLDYADMNILACAGAWHDIGRNNDRDDNIHGRKSVSKIKNLKLDKNMELDKKDKSILYAIILNHCIDDNIGIKSILDDKNIIDKEKAVSLYKIFKDCDALDRIRIKDLDLKYLRNDISNKLIIVAGQLYQTMK